MIYVPIEITFPPLWIGEGLYLNCTEYIRIGFFAGAGDEGVRKSGKERKTLTEMTKEAHKGYS